MAAYDPLALCVFGAGMAQDRLPHNGTGDSPPTRPHPAAAAMPEFTRVIRGLAHVSKAELDAAIAREKAQKKQRPRKK
jgi:hypothetical protein